MVKETHAKLSFAAASWVSPVFRSLMARGIRDNLNLFFSEQSEAIVPGIWRGGDYTDLLCCWAENVSVACIFEACTLYTVL